QASQLVMKDRWEAATRRGVWNNARLVQYRNYSSEYDRFAALLAKNNGDIPAFIQSIQQITKGRKDPFAALAEVVDVPGVKNP
ncbi:MAG TPA: aminopeptidase, partial [Myxococcota bacterium]|nr:aminopeptidase [Myxococcota bacterium]